MKRILILMIALTWLFGTADAQIWKGAGLGYTKGVPSHIPGARDGEVAIDTATGYWYGWDRLNSQWTELGARVQFQDSTGIPTVTPDQMESRVVVSSTGSLFVYVGGSWTTVGGGTDDQTLLLDSTGYNFSLSIEDGNSIAWSKRLSHYHNDAGYVTGSGTANELPYWVTSTSLGSLTTATYPSLLELSYIKGLTSSAQTQLGAKHGGSLTTGYVPYSPSGGYGLANSNIYYSGTNVGIGTASPVYLLSVNGWGNFGAIQVLPNTGGSDYIQTESGKDNFIIRNKSGTGFITFGTGGGVERFRITASGNVGIGQTTPIARTHITGPGSTNLTTALLVENSLGTDALVANDASTVTVPNGQLGVGTTSPAASAKLDVTSTTQGFLPPRMTTAQRDAIASTANGLIIFCTDCTATDGSTGVSQTYSSSSWRNHY